jgi:hypothetical protein
VGRFGVLAAVIIAAAAGGGAAEYWYRTRAQAPVAAQGASAATLQADVDRLKSIVPTQSHTMTDVGYHWSNLWFAAQHRNWPLARFFFNEARQSIRWTVLIRPVRKLPDGGDVDIKAIYDGIDPSSMAAVDIAIEQEDYTVFEADYKVAIETCYACHKAAGLPFLRPQIPTVAPTTMINYDPKATWP